MDNMTETEKLAWAIYCRETAGSMDVRDFWHELSDGIKAIFIAKASTQVQSIVGDKK